MACFGMNPPGTQTLEHYLYDLVAMASDNILSHMLPALHEAHGDLYLRHPEGGDGRDGFDSTGPIKLKYLSQKFNENVWFVLCHDCKVNALEGFRAERSLHLVVTVLNGIGFTNFHKPTQWCNTTP